MSKNSVLRRIFVLNKEYGEDGENYVTKTSHIVGYCRPMPNIFREIT
jgi:hypothetical protein